METLNYAVGLNAPIWLCIDSPSYQRRNHHYTHKGDIKVAYGVDQFPNPPELPSGHFEWDSDDDGRPIKRWVRDYDENGQKIEEEV